MWFWNWIWNSLFIHDIMATVKGMHAFPTWRHSAFYVTRFGTLGKVDDFAPMTLPNAPPWFLSNQRRGLSTTQMGRKKGITLRS